MRHNKSFNHLGRTSAHRKAMLSNMACSLIMHKRIETTTAKAKALKKVIEPLITRSKDDTTHSRRIAFSVLQDKEAVTELFREVSAKVGDRPGGYTRIIRLGNRLGDNADICMMELVDFNELLLSEKSAAKKASKGRRRGSKKKTEETTAAAVAAPNKETAVAAPAPNKETAAAAPAPIKETAAAVAAPIEETAAAVAAPIEETAAAVAAPIEETAVEEVVAPSEETEAVAEEQPVAEVSEDTEAKAEDTEAKAEDPKEEESTNEDKKES